MILYLSIGTRALLRFLRTSAPDSTIFFSPTSLSLFHVSAILSTLLFKSILQLIGWSPSIKSFAAADGVVNLPELSLTMPLVIGNEEVRRYHAALGQERPSLDDDSLVLDGPNLAMFLSAQTEGTMLLLLAHRKCPIQALGSVNVRNQIKLLRPDLVSVPKLREPGVMWLARATLKREARWVKRGVECDFVVTLSRRSALEGEDVFQQVFTVLQFINHARRDVEKQAPAAESSEKQTPPSSVTPLHLESASPSKWAAVCKDYNPIHTSTLLARAFGFPSIIAHGNHVLARALSAAPNQHMWSAQRPIEIAVDFRRPVMVPTVLDIEFFLQDAPANDGNGLQIRVRRKQKICVEASINEI